MLRYRFVLPVNRRKQHVSGTLCLMLFLSLTDSVVAQSTPRTLVRVEEDWVALIGEPDAATSSPQIMNFISPVQSTSGIFGLVQVNHRGAPDFHDGGLQVQGWIGSSMRGSANATKSARLNRKSDALSYTVAMEKTSEGIVFELLNGRSRTWGKFAQSPVSVHVDMESPSLEDYSPEYSVNNTNVNLGAHRVELLYLSATRLKYSDQTTVTDNTDRVIHRYQLHVEDVPLTEYELNIDDYNIDITE